MSQRKYIVEFRVRPAPPDLDVKNNVRAIAEVTPFYVGSDGRDRFKKLVCEHQDIESAIAWCVAKVAILRDEQEKLAAKMTKRP